MERFSLTPFVDILANTTTTRLHETDLPYTRDWVGQPCNVTSCNQLDSGTEERVLVSTGHDNTVYKVCILILYLTSLLVGLLGNSLVIYVIARFTTVRTKSVANYYILNLAVADVVFILTVPLFCYATFSENWLFGNPVCKISYVFREINKFGSIFTLTALSVDRFLASFHELSHLRTIRMGKVVCVAVWVASLVMCSPYFLYAYSETAGSVNGSSVCRIHWPRDHTLYHRRLWTYSQLAIGLISPLLVIVTSYLMLMRRLKGIMALRQTQRTKRPNKKLTRTVIIVVITFVMCHVPYYVLDIISLHKAELAVTYASRGQVYQPGRTELMTFIYCNALAQMLLFISCCSNPIIYGITNDNFCKCNFITSLFLQI